MLARVLVPAILLGWMLPPPLPVEARWDSQWWQARLRWGSGGDSSSSQDEATSGANDISVATFSPGSGSNFHMGTDPAIIGAMNPMAISSGILETESDDVLIERGSSSAVSDGISSTNDAKRADSNDDDNSNKAAGGLNGSEPYNAHSTPEDADNFDAYPGNSSTESDTSSSRRRRSNRNSSGDSSDSDDSGVSDVDDSDGSGVSDVDYSDDSGVSDDSATDDTSSSTHASGSSPTAGDEWASADPQCARANLSSLSKLSKSCFVMHRVCIDQETLVTHDWQYSYANPRREPLPTMPGVDNWNFPVGGVNTDALNGRGPHYRFHVRPASSYEPIPALQNPVFTNCTLPFIVVADFPYNMGEFFAKILTAIDRVATKALDDKVTMVIQTPMGLQLAAFHTLFLMSYSRFPAITAANLGSRGSGCNATSNDDNDCQVQGPVPWSSEPQQPHCFQRMIICKWDLKMGGGSPLAVVADRVVSAFIDARLLPSSRVQYSSTSNGSSRSRSRRLTHSTSDTRSTSTLRVLIESRHGPVRNIKNIKELVDACQSSDRAGFTAGRFRHLSCAATSFTNPDGSVDRERFLANVAAVRSAHVLVVMHGAGATNGWFMWQGSSALIELRPCRFGTRFGAWPDKYMPRQHERNDDVIRFFALNIEDDDQCITGDIENSLHNHTTIRENVGWDASFFARDQHLQLKPGPFLEFIRHVGELFLDINQYTKAKESDKLHGYVVPEGLMYGKLGITDLPEYLETEKPSIIPF